MSQDILAYIPHRPPMLLLAELVHSDAHIIHARACVDTGNPFLSSTGVLDRCALIEMMAQTFALGQGALAAHEMRTPMARGYLASMRDVTFTADVHAGDSLDIYARPLMQVGNVVVVDGSVERHGHCVCQGQCKIFLVPTAEGAV